MKNFFTLVFLIMLALPLYADSASTKNPKSTSVILGYYPSWRAKYLPPADMQYKYFNYLTQAFLSQQRMAKLGYTVDFDNQQFVKSAHANGTKVFLSLGYPGTFNLHS